MSERKEISLQELDDLVHNGGPNVDLSKVEVSGVAVIKDKDGNIKGTMEIVSLETQELEENANS